MEPTGAIRDVGVGDLFFSVTDHKGEIRQVNSTLVRLSAFSREELLGSSHNILRHPMMPGGLFRLMWDRLAQGQPFVAYMHNLAADGARYDVFATITPLPDGGFLSVRTRPLVEDGYAWAAMLYEAACDLEDALRSGGMSRAQAAERGAVHLLGLIADGGLGTLEETMFAVLPAEVAALDARVGGLPDRPGATGVLGELLCEVRALFAELSQLMDRVAPITDLMRAMRDAASVLQTTIDRSTALAAMMAARPGIEEDLAQVTEPLRRWMSVGGEIDALMHVLMADMEEFRDIASRSRFLVALARLHVYMTGYFVVELIDDYTGNEEALPAIVSLADALVAGFDALSCQTPIQQQAAAEAIGRIEGAAHLMEGPSDVMAKWRATAAADDLPVSILDLLPQVDAELESSRMAVDQLRSIADQCADIGTFTGAEALRVRVERIHRLADRLSAA